MDSDLSLREAQRHLQLAAARSFTNEPPTDFTEDELKQEAAFRAWLTTVRLDVPPLNPFTLPSPEELSLFADHWDYLYGELQWWAWPIWSTCKTCCELNCISCAQCFKLSQFCYCSEAWSEQQ